jgi:hypothetical protein
MSAATITPLTKDEALRTYGGPLPPGIDREEYEGSLGALKADGVESLESWEINTIKRVIEHQKSVNVGAPSQDVEAEPNEGDADQSLPTDAKQLEPQAAPQDVEPSEETG